MNPKDGKAGSVVSPAEAKAAFEADTADPGKMAELKTEQHQSKTGKYNPVKTQPHQAGDGKSGDSETQEEKKSWIEIELIDDEKRPVPGARYAVTLPDSTVAEGTLDEKGFARIEGITPGSCKITFPDYDQSCWKAASGGGGSSASGGKSGGGGAKSGSQSSAAGADGKSGGESQGIKSGGGDSGGGQGVKSGDTQDSGKTF